MEGVMMEPMCKKVPNEGRFLNVFDCRGWCCELLVTPPATATTNRQLAGARVALALLEVQRVRHTAVDRPVLR